MYINPKSMIGMPVTGRHVWGHAYEHDNVVHQNQITFQTHVVDYQNHKGAKFKDGQHSH